MVRCTNMQRHNDFRAYVRIREAGVAPPVMWSLFMNGSQKTAKVRQKNSVQANECKKQTRKTIRSRCIQRVRRSSHKKKERERKKHIKINHIFASVISSGDNASATILWIFSFSFRSYKGISAFSLYRVVSVCHTNK